MTGKWYQLSDKFDVIDTSDYGDLWTVQIGELRRVHRRLYQGWTFVPGPENRDTLKQVSDVRCSFILVQGKESADHLDQSKGLRGCNWGCQSAHFEHVLRVLAVSSDTR